MIWDRDIGIYELERMADCDCVTWVYDTWVSLCLMSVCYTCMSLPEVQHESTTQVSKVQCIHVPGECVIWLYHMGATYEANAWSKYMKKVHMAMIAYDHQLLANINDCWSQVLQVKSLAVWRNLWQFCVALYLCKGLPQGYILSPPLE